MSWEWMGELIYICKTILASGIRALIMQHPFASPPRLHRASTRMTALVESTSPSDIKPTGWSRDAIDSVAARIAGELGYKPGGDLRPIVEKLGGRIEVEPWEPGAHSGMLEVSEQGNFTIWLSPFTAELRDRFTIAHELGHFFLHADAGEKPIKIKREGNSRVESEANWFAAGFLLPQKAFLEAYRKFGGSIAALSSRFNVSDSVIATRIKVLREMGHEFPGVP